MRILMFSSEKDFLNPETRAAQRLLPYEKYVDSLDVFVADRRTIRTHPVHVSPKITIYPVQKKLGFNMFRTFVRAATALGRTYNPSEVVVTSQGPFEPGLAAYLVAKKLGVAFHLQVHTDIQSPYFKYESVRRFLQVFLARFLLRRADTVRVVSRRIYDTVVRWGISPSRIARVPLNIPWQAIQQKQPESDLHKQYPQHTPIVLMASRLSPEKNISLALRAFKAFLKNAPTAGMVIVGRGAELERLKDETTKLGIQANVFFEEWSEDIVSHLKTADIFLLTSDYEGWGVAVVEAAAAGLPVVMTDVGCAGEFLLSGESGVIVPVRDKEAVARALTNLAASSQERTRLAQGATDRLPMIPDQETYERAIMASYQQALQHHETSHTHPKGRHNR